MLVTENNANFFRFLWLDYELLVMSKQARVTPRNIQFLNEVQVKEIPSIHADPDNLSQHIEWDPNLTGVRYF